MIFFSRELCPAFNILHVVCALLSFIMRVINNWGKVEHRHQCMSYPLVSSFRNRRIGLDLDMKWKLSVLNVYSYYMNIKVCCTNYKNIFSFCSFEHVICTENVFQNYHKSVCDRYLMYIQFLYTLMYNVSFFFVGKLKYYKLPMFLQTRGKQADKKTERSIHLFTWFHIYIIFNNIHIFNYCLCKATTLNL